MKKLLALLVCLAGLVMYVPSAHAAYDYNFFANADNSSTSGIWNVRFATNDYQLWSVYITPNGSVPNNTVNTITLGILDGFNNPTAVMSSNSAHTNLQPMSSQKPWTSGIFGQGISYGSPDAPNNLQRIPYGTPGNPSATLTGGNAFFAQFTLATPMKFGTLSARLSNGGNSWYGTQAYTPEMPGAALLLPALLPVGMVLRGKKRGVRNMFRNSSTV